MSRSRCTLMTIEHRRGFSLIELLICTAIAACVIGWYINAVQEADALARMLRGDDRAFKRMVATSPRMVKANLADADSSVANPGNDARPNPAGDPGRTEHGLILTHAPIDHEQSGAVNAFDR